MNKSVHFSSASDRWATPADLYAALDAEFRFNVAPCSLDGKGDGLAPLLRHWRGKRVFCNPPYGRHVSDWIRRRAEAEVAVFLLPARTDTRWFHELVLPHAVEVSFLRGRLKFAESKNAAPLPSIVAVINKLAESKKMRDGSAVANIEQSNASDTAGVFAQYFACEFCSAKWFCDEQLSQRPRCGAIAVSNEKSIPLWNRSRN